MNIKYRSFLGRISAETDLKIYYFGSPKVSKRWGLAPRPCLDLMNRECAKTLHLLYICGWCSCIAILGQNETLLF